MIAIPMRPRTFLARGLVEWEREFSTAGEVKAVEAAVNEVVGASAITGAGHSPLDAGIPIISIDTLKSNLEYRNYLENSWWDSREDDYRVAWVILLKIDSFSRLLHKR